MEPRGGKRWQSVANRIDAIAAKTIKTVATGCDRLPKAAHGKEGVDGSSPSEGSAKAPHNGFFVSDQVAGCRTWGRYGALYGAKRAMVRRGRRLPLLRTSNTTRAA